MTDKFVKQQQSLLMRGLIDRRQFMTSALAAGVAVPAALGLATQAFAATPKKGGMMRFGMGHGSTTDTLDPATYENAWSQNVGYAFSNHLTEVGPNGQLRPELAESYEASASETILAY